MDNYTGFHTFEAIRRCSSRHACRDGALGFYGKSFSGGDIPYNEYVGTFNYDSLQVQVNRKLSKASLFGLADTFSAYGANRGEGILLTQELTQDGGISIVLNGLEKTPPHRWKLCGKTLKFCAKFCVDTEEIRDYS